MTTFFQYDSPEYILKLHHETYPLMTPCDAVKLLYQNEFGGGHMITDPQASLHLLEKEYHTLSLAGSRLWEEIGNGYARLNLHALDTDRLPLDMVNRIFVQSSSELHGTQEAFFQKLEVLKELTQKGIFSFTEDALNQYLAEYAVHGYPAVSHSETYRQAYHPAYRVIRMEYIAYLPLIEAGLAVLSRHLQTSSSARTDSDVILSVPVLMALDGCSASGKTTAANLLGALLDATVIHMDDFFLPLPMRTSTRLNEPGGNVHYERFRKEVLEPILAGQSPVYRVFDCSTGDYGKTIHSRLTPLVIIEGAYALHPYLNTDYSITAFFEISSGEQKRRILARNGAVMFQNFAAKWIPMENKYFTECLIPEKCQFVIRTEDFI